MSISVLVADDHEVVRTGLARLLQGAEIDIVAEAENGEQAVEQTLRHAPDVVLMDVRMPDGDGLVALEKIRAAKPDVRVVMLSTYDNPTYVARSVALGAADYVLKGSSREALIAAITRAAAGDPPPENSLLHGVKETMARLRDRQDAGDVPLTNRELQVLRHVALGLSNREIGHSLKISIETVKEHVQNILRKIDAADRTQAAVWAIKKGFV
ncbi:MAG: response regulator transcription factor [Pirellulaceae bacterium]